MLRQYYRYFTETVFHRTTNGEAYVVSLKGEVSLVTGYGTTSAVSKKLKPVIKNNEQYYLIDGEMYRLANIINFAFKGKPENSKYDYLTRDIVFLDGNPNNLSPGNMVWNNTNVKDDEDGFRTIPGYSRYKINREGVVLIREDGYEMTRVITPTGHVYLNLTPDVHNRNNAKREAVHRAMAYAFLPIPKDYYNKDISHIDNNPTNNKLENLEWATRRQNNMNSVIKGNHSQAKQVLVRDVRTDKVMEFPSRRECARFFNVHPTKITNRCKSNGKKVFQDFMQYCIKSEFSGWGTGTKPAAQISAFSDPKNRYYSGKFKDKTENYVLVKVEIENTSNGKKKTIIFPEEVLEFYQLKPNYLSTFV